MSRARSRFLTALLEVLLVFKPVRRLVSFWNPCNVNVSMLDARAGVPNMWFKPLTPQGGSPSGDIPLLFCGPGSQPDSSFPFLSDSCGSFFYSFCFRRIFLSISSLFAERIAPLYGRIFDVFMGGSELNTFLLCHLDLLSSILLLSTSLCVCI